MAQANGVTKIIARRRSLLSAEQEKLKRELGEAPAESRFRKAFFEPDEEKPSASVKKPKRRSLLTRLLSLIGGLSRPGNKELTAKKARTMLTEDVPRSAKQKRFLGAIAGGEKPRRK